MSMDIGVDAPGREAWALIGELMMANRQRLIDAAAEEGLAPPQAFALMRLREVDPLHLRDLARHMHCDPSYVTSIADRLEERGFALRRPSPADRRLKELVLTPAGVEAQARLKAAILKPPDGLLEMPDEDQRTLLRIARALAETARAAEAAEAADQG
jgi:MarR family transcriptional regulator, organic hydroperoxide resistance regulator